MKPAPSALALLVLPSPLARRLATVNAGFAALALAAPPLFGTAGAVAIYISAGWAFLAVAMRALPPTPDRDAWRVGLCWWAMGAAYLVSAAVNGLPGNPVAQLSWLLAYALVPFLASTLRLAPPESLVRGAIAGASIACVAGLGVAAAEVALGDFGGRTPRAAGLTNNAIVFATTMTLAAATALAGAFTMGGRAGALRLAASFCGLGAVALSGSRWALAIAAAAVAAVLLMRASAVGRRAWIALGVAAVALGGLAVMGPAGRFAEIAPNLAEMAERGNYATEIGERVAMWRIGLDLALERPLLGHGAGHAQALLNARLASDYGMERGFSHFHNGFLTLLVEAGIAALAAVLAALALLARIALRNRGSDDPSRRFGATLLAAFVVVTAVGGLMGKMLAHDILDASALAVMALGLVLAGRAAAG